jgi:hypothetical protein
VLSAAGIISTLLNTTSPGSPLDSREHGRELNTIIEVMQESQIPASISFVLVGKRTRKPQHDEPHLR